MSKPSNEAQRILDWLVVNALPGVNPGFPKTYAGYKEVLDALGLPHISETYGLSLQAQGLEDLAIYLKESNLPAITGIIVSISDNDPRPSQGYFTVHERATKDREWWAEEVRKSKAFNWLPHLGFEAHCTLSQRNRQEEESDNTPETPKCFDTEGAEIPQRELVEAYRIIRDTLRSRRVKKAHDYVCQLCRRTTLLFGEKPYAEGHHIWPLGRKHNGPDEEWNILCLCPTCHIKLDYGAEKIDLSKLRRVTGHDINPEMVKYHNENLYGKI